VVWASNEESGNLHGIFGQLYSSTGQLQGTRILVSTTATYDDLAPAVAMTADGRFLVAWQANEPSGWSILARAFQAGGIPVGGEIAVNLPAAGARHSPAVAYLPPSAAEPAERFEIVWQAEGQDGSGGSTTSPSRTAGASTSSTPAAPAASSPR
jgi:hypothetical protein